MSSSSTVGRAGGLPVMTRMLAGENSCSPKSILPLVPPSHPRGGMKKVIAVASWARAPDVNRSVIASSRSTPSARTVPVADTSVGSPRNMCLVGGHGEGLLAQHMLARPQRATGVLEVRGVWGSDVDGIDLLGLAQG